MQVHHVKIIFSYFLIMLLSPTLSNAEGCPGNFKPITPGDSIQKIIFQCGEPNDRIEYKQTYRETSNNDNMQNFGIYNQTQNTYGSSEINNSNNMNVSRERTVIITKLRYGNVNLVFVDGKWSGAE